MCNFSPDMPNVKTPPPPPPPSQGPKLADVLGIYKQNQVGPDGLMIRRQRGVNSLRIARDGAASGVNVPNG